MVTILDLAIAEIELANDFEQFAVPPWAAAEVSDDPRYFNSNLVLNPYKNWKDIKTRSVGMLARRRFARAGARSYLEERQKSADLDTLAMRCE